MWENTQWPSMSQCSREEQVKLCEVLHWVQSLWDWRLQKWLVSAKLPSSCKLCECESTLSNVDSSRGHWPCFMLAELLVVSNSSVDVWVSWQLSVEMWTSSLVGREADEQDKEVTPLLCTLTVGADALLWVTQVEERGLLSSLITAPLCPPLTSSSVYRSNSTSSANGGWLTSSFFLVLSRATCWHQWTINPQQFKSIYCSRWLDLVGALFSHSPTINGAGQFQILFWVMTEMCPLHSRA